MRSPETISDSFPTFARALSNVRERGWIGALLYVPRAGFFLLWFLTLALSTFRLDSTPFPHQFSPTILWIYLAIVFVVVLLYVLRPELSRGSNLIVRRKPDGNLGIFEKKEVPIFRVRPDGGLDLYSTEEVLISSLNADGSSGASRIYKNWRGEVTGILVRNQSPKSLSRKFSLIDHLDSVRTIQSISDSNDHIKTLPAVFNPRILSVVAIDLACAAFFASSFYESFGLSIHWLYFGIGLGLAFLVALTFLQTDSGVSLGSSYSKHDAQ